MTFFVQWKMSTENHHCLDFPATLPIYSSPHTCYFWEFHPTSPCLLKISPLVKDLGVGYKFTPIISVSRISQCNHLEFLPLLQSLFFCFVHVLWFDIFGVFADEKQIRENQFHKKEVLDHFRDKKFPRKNCIDPSAKITPYKKNCNRNE